MCLFLVQNIESVAGINYHIYMFKKVGEPPGEGGTMTPGRPSRQASAILFEIFTPVMSLQIVFHALCV